MIRPGLSQAPLDLWLRFEKQIKRDKDLKLVEELPAEPTKARIEIGRQTLTAKDGAKSAQLIGSTVDVSLSANALRAQEAWSRITRVAKQFERDHGMYPGRNQLVRLAHCSKNLASKVLRELTN